MRAGAADTPSLEDRGHQEPYLYDAFLSYDHDDHAVAEGLQRGLHRVGRRLGRLHALRVFRDSTDLSASPDLWGKVAEAMDRSRYMIVVLSPLRPSRDGWTKRSPIGCKTVSLTTSCLSSPAARCIGTTSPRDSTRSVRMPRCRCSRSRECCPPSRSTSTSATMRRGIWSQRCFVTRSPTWPPRFTGNPNMNWPARISVSSAVFADCAAPRSQRWRF